MPTENTATNWDAGLNTLFDDHIEADIDSIEATADAAMPKAGGVFTGEVEILSSVQGVVDKGATMSGTLTLDLDNGEFFHGTMTGAVTTFSIANWTASKVQHVEFEITNGGTAAWTWPSAIKWDGGTDPSFQSSGVDVVVFYSRDGGTTIRGMHAYSNTS